MVTTSGVCFHFFPVWRMPMTINLRNASILIINFNVISIITCFSCFIFLAALVLQVLIDDIVATQKLDVHIRLKIVEDKIRTWKQYFRLVVDYLQELNQCFGLALLCYTLKVFVISITKTFAFLITMAPDEFFADVRFVTSHSISFCNLVWNCHRFQAKVTSPLGRFFRVSETFESLSASSDSYRTAEASTRSNGHPVQSKLSSSN